jgi:hypothetical protein
MRALSPALQHSVPPHHLPVRIFYAAAVCRRVIRIFVGSSEETEASIHHTSTLHVMQHAFTFVTHGWLRQNFGRTLRDALRSPW